jgi:hypothetical protein
MRFWVDDEIELLKGSVVYDEFRKDMRSTRRRHEFLRRRVFKAHPGLFPADHFDLDRFHWANAIVESRKIEDSAS